MSADYYKTLIKDIIENNEKEKAIEIIANKLNEKQISNEKEMLTNLDKDKEIERLKDLCDKYEEEHKTTFEEWKKAINIIKEVRECIEKEYVQVKNKEYNLSWNNLEYIIKELLEILDRK